MDLARLSAAELHRLPAVSPTGVLLGLHQVPGVVLAEVWQAGDPGVWMPQGQHVVAVWGGEGPTIWAAIQASVPDGAHVSLVVMPVTRWVRVVAWIRRKAWGAKRWLYEWEHRTRPGGPG